MCRYFDKSQAASLKDEREPRSCEKVRGEVQVVRCTDEAKQFHVGALPSERPYVPRARPVRKRHILGQNHALPKEQNFRKKAGRCRSRVLGSEMAVACGDLLLSPSVEPLTSGTEIHETVWDQTRFGVDVTPGPRVWKCYQYDFLFSVAAAESTAACSEAECSSYDLPSAYHSCRQTEGAAMDVTAYSLGYLVASAVGACYHMNDYMRVEVCRVLNQEALLVYALAFLQEA